MATFHMFKLPAEGLKMMTIEEASQYCGPDKNYVKKRIEEIMLNYRNRKTLKDAFEPGWQENIREHITCPGEYKRRLKELGLVEIGYDYTPQSSEREGDYLKGEEFAKAVAEIDPTLTGNEFEAIKSGEMFKDSASKCNLSPEE